jgi:hypothetical protein
MNLKDFFTNVTNPSKKVLMSLLRASPPLNLNQVPFPSLQTWFKNPRPTAVPIQVPFLGLSPKIMVAHCWISGVFAPDLLASFHIHVTPFRAF